MSQKDAASKAMFTCIRDLKKKLATTETEKILLLNLLRHIQYRAGTLVFLLTLIQYKYGTSGYKYYDRWMLDTALPNTDAKLGFAWLNVSNMRPRYSQRYN